MFKKMVKKYGKFNFGTFIFTTLLLIGSIVSMIIVDDDTQRSRMVFTALLCFLMDAIIIIPPLITERIKLQMPKTIETAYILFAFGAIILGDVANFYDKIRIWDSILHTFSGLLLGALGFILINTLNNSENTNMTLSPIFVCCVSVCFAVTVGALWELCEFTADGIFGMNSQQFMKTTAGTLISEGDIPLEGHEALRDTMKDLFLDLLGAIIMAIIGYFEIKHKKSNSIVAYKIARTNEVSDNQKQTNNAQDINENESPNDNCELSETKEENNRVEERK